MLVLDKFLSSCWKGLGLRQHTTFNSKCFGNERLCGGGVGGLPRELLQGCLKEPTPE